MSAPKGLRPRKPRGLATAPQRPQGPRPGFVRKDRRDGVTGETRLGPVHRIDMGEGFALTYCGRRLRGFGLSQSTDRLDGVPCARCEANHDTGRRDAWKP